MLHEIDPNSAYIFISSASAIGFLFGIYNWYAVSSIKLENDTEIKSETKQINENTLRKLREYNEKISDGAAEFLKWEYIYISIFLLIFSATIVMIDQYKFYTTIAFILGAITSLISGWIGMSVATTANARVTFSAALYSDDDVCYRKAFNVAYRGGMVMGFCLVSLALFVLLAIIFVYQSILKPNDLKSFTEMFEFIAGYGLGGSAVALFCRVGGGIYTKAADVGADLVGKYESDLAEDDGRNPATIADNVGDNVGDIAGMGSDLFGSFAESTVAALVVSGNSRELLNGANFLYPLIISSVGILVCLISTSFTHLFSIKSNTEGSNKESRSGSIENILKWQIIISTILLTPSIIGISLICLPKNIGFLNEDKSIFNVSQWSIIICCILGLYSGLIIGYFTDFWTSNSSSPVIELANSCKKGAAINVINGLALGYYSCAIPVICITGTIFYAFEKAKMYGIAIAALGMLSNLCICLSIDAYGPISDNAGGLAELAGFGENDGEDHQNENRVREKTDDLDAAGNTTAAIGKGFAIGSACLVSLALFGAFVTRTQIYDVDIMEPIEMTCLVVGAMIPYAFSALTMKSVGKAAGEMCVEIRKMLANDPNNEKNYMTCINVSTKASLREMILPGMIVIFTPLILGAIFGPKAVAGYLAGVIVSGVQMAISASNTGGAWDNAKKYIEKKNLMIDNLPEGQVQYYGKGSKPHKAAVVGDTVGDPLKDTSGPSLNILIKLSAITSLVFGGYFSKNALIKERGARLRL